MKRGAGGSGVTSRSIAPCRLIVVAPHVVQYHAPFYRELARRPELDVLVLYLDDAGARPTWDATMGATIEWDVPLLEGYAYEFVRSLSPRPDSSLPGHGDLTSRIGRGLTSRLLKKRFDAVLIQGHGQLPYWLALLCARIRRKSVLYRGESNLREPRRGFREGAKRALLKTLFRFSQVVFFSCSGNRRFLLHYGCRPEQMVLLPCAVDNDYFRRGLEALAGEEAAIRRDLDIPPGTRVLLNVGRHDANKSQSDLLRALGVLQRQGLDVALLLVGNGPETPELNRLAEDLGLAHVRFTGFVNQSQILRYYAVADVFALCSAYDASPKVLNEALNFELPIVCSDRAGTAGDVAVDGENGFLYPWGDVEALARALSRLVVDSDLRRRMGQRSMELADAWSLEAGADAVVSALTTLRLEDREPRGRPT